MKDLESLKVVSFTRDRVPNKYPGGELPWQVYHGVRNALVQTCRQYGPTGPRGVIKLAPDVEDPALMGIKDRDFWESGDPDPTFAEPGGAEVVRTERGKRRCLKSHETVSSEVEDQFVQTVYRKVGCN